MKTLTKQELIKVVAGRWYEHYYKNAHYSDEWFQKFEPTYRKLLALENPTEEQITKVIGNNSWTRITCDFCSKDVDKVIIQNVNDKPIYVCRNCITLAQQLLDNLK